MAHQCSICLKIFKCASKLQRHHLIHTGEKPFICSVCGKAFRQAIHLKRHLEKHTGNEHALNPFTGSWGQFESVERVETSTTAYPTVLDDMGINYTPDVPFQACVSSGVEELTQTVHGDYVAGLKAIEQPEFKLISPDGVINTDWECLSGKDLRKQILQEHQVSSSRVDDAISNADSVLQCAVCLKFCNSPYQLQKHLLVHSRLDHFECSICKQTFSQMAQLKFHSRKQCEADLTHDVIEVCSSPAAENVAQCSTSQAKTKTIHQCPDCTKSFCSPSKLRRHCLSHTGQRPYHCIECGKSFRQLAHLKTHQDTHRTVLSIHAPLHEETSGASRFKDGNSDKYISDSELTSFSSLSPSLQSHIPLNSRRLFNRGISSNAAFIQRSHQIEKKQEASAPVSENINEWNSEESQVPEKKAFHEDNIKKHHLNQEKFKPFQCLVCGQAFSQADNFQKHLCEDTDQDEFANQGEDMESDSSPSEQPHQEIKEHHDSDLKMTLQTDELNALDLNIIVKPEHWPSSDNEGHVPAPDGTACTTESQLQPALDNMKAKHWELTKKNHQCGTCLKCFPTPYKLQRHMLIHTGQRPFSCRVCGKRFRQLAHLMLHNRTHFRPEHTNGKRTSMNSHPSPIQIGYDHVSSGSALKFDVTMHENVPENRGSKERVLRSTDLNRRSRRVLEQDNLVHNKSLNNERKNGHIKHQCSLCLKCFSCPSKLQRHHLIHTGQKPFRCTLCGKTFRQAIHLKVHLQTHNKWRPFRRASLQKGVVNTDQSNASRQQHQSTESGHQEQLATEHQGNPPTSDGQEKDSGPKSATYECDKGDPTMHFVSNTSVKLEDRLSDNNGSLQSIHEGVKSTKQCEHQLTSNDSVNECEKVKRKTYQCVTCLKCFLTPYKLQRHVLTHTGQRPFSCYVCGRKFRQLSHMKFHICTRDQPRSFQQRKKDENNYLCSSQQVEFDTVTSETTLESDITLQNTCFEQENPLEICLSQSASSEKGFDQYNVLACERNRSHGKHQCLICLKYFSCPSKLQRHLLIHTGQKPFRCVLCGKTFRQAIHLKVHQQTHNKWRSLKRASQQDELDNTNASNGAGPHLTWSSSFQGQHTPTIASQCDVIASDCSLQETLENHDMDHMLNSPEPGPVNTLAVQFDQDTVTVPRDLLPNDESASIPHKTTILTEHPQLVSKQNLNACRELKRNRYQCVVCLKCFSSPSKLQRHILSHTGQRPFSCHVCGKKFRQLSHMKFHVLTHNRPKITQQNRTFSIHKNLLDSVPSITTLDSDLPLQQKSPEKGIVVPLKLSRNLPSSEALLDHGSVFDYGRNSGNVKHQCLICFKYFTSPSKLRRHNLIHTGQKPYQCVLCGKTFRQAIHLKVHQQTHNKWRAFRRTVQKEDLHKSREQDKALGIVPSAPLASSQLNVTGLNQFPSKEVVEDDICGGRVVLEEHKPQPNAEINTEAFQDKPSQLKSYNPGDLLQTHFQCNICYRNFKQLSNLKTHCLTHLEAHPAENSFPMKNETCQKQTNYGLEEEDQKVNFAINQPTYISNRHPLNSTLDTGVVSGPNKCNTQDQASKESSDIEGTNTQQGNGDLDCSILSINGRVENSRLQHCTSTLHITQEDEYNWDRFSAVDQEESDCVIIGSTDSAGVESPVTLQHANENTEIRHSIKTGCPCPVCSKCFSSSSQQQHSHTQRTAIKPSTCPFCLKEFVQRSLLNSHQCMHKDRRDSGQFSLSNTRQFEEQDGQELAVCNQSSHSTTTEPVVNTWHPAMAGYIDSQNQDMSSLTGFTSMRKVKHTRKAYQCKVCLKNFESPYKLWRHFLIHTGVKPFKCSVCNKSFRQLCHLQSHQQTHRGKIFKEVEQMDDGHGFDHAEDYPSPNLASEGHFSTAPVPQEAKLINALHLSDDTSYPLKSSTNRSLTVGDSSDPSAENIASGSVGALHIIPDAELEQEIKQSRRDLKCSECQKSFSSPSKLERHNLIHAGERPFKCSICDKAFRQAAHLKVHQRVHDKMSVDRSSDSVHNRQDSSRSQTMEDISETLNYGMSEDISDRQESQAAGVEVALESEHCDEYWCEPLDGVFKCMDCNKSFATKRRLQLHRCFSESKQSDTQSSFYQCAICFKNFKSPYKLKRHYVIHTGERPYRCSVCKKTFTQSGHLKTHLLSHK